MSSQSPDAVSHHSPTLNLSMTSLLPNRHWRAPTILQVAQKPRKGTQPKKGKLLKASHCKVCDTLSHLFSLFLLSAKEKSVPIAQMRD